MRCGHFHETANYLSIRVVQIHEIAKRLSHRLIMAWYRSNQTSKILHHIPRVDPMLLWSQILLTPRNFSTWIGLEPKQHSSGGNDRLGSIRKQVIAIRAACSSQGHSPSFATPRSRNGHRPWLTALLARRPTKVTAIALAGLHDPWSFHRASLRWAHGHRDSFRSCSTCRRGRFCCRSRRGLI